MQVYQAPLRDMRFVLHELHGLDRITALPAFAEATGDVVDGVLDEAARMAEEVILPLNASGDLEGCALPELIAQADLAASADTAAEVATSWDAIKKTEKQRESATDGIALGQPALALAAKLVSRSTRASSWTPSARTTWARALRQASGRAS